jgi:hypothetical protein
MLLLHMYSLPLPLPSNNRDKHRGTQTNERNLSTSLIWHKFQDTHIRFYIDLFWHSKVNKGSTRKYSIMI